MNNKTLLSYFAIITLFLSACGKKDGDTIINNYGSAGEGKIPVRKMMKGYGSSDSSYTALFKYQNNEVGKVKELYNFSSGVMNFKYIILYNGANKPEGFQNYSMPANTLDAQGTFKLDDEGRIIEVIKRKVNGDTIGIAYFQYDGADYQPASFSYFDKTANRISVYEYYIYDQSGNITKTITYTDNGTDPLYKSAESEASGFGKAINPLNQIYNYIVTIAQSGGFSSSASLYLSNYFPSTIRTQAYKVDGTPGNVNLNNLKFTADGDKNALSLSNVGSSSAPLYFRY